MEVTQVTKSLKSKYVDIIKYKTQKAVAHAARASQLFGFGLFVTFHILYAVEFWI